MKFHIYTLGCKVNQYESQVMHENLIQKGFVYTQNSNTADIVIINSCTVTAVSDSKAVKLMHRIKRENPECILILTGCLSQAFPHDNRFIQADIILGNRSRSKLIPSLEKFLMRKVRIIDVTDHQKDDAFEPMTVHDFNDRTRAFVKIEDGCNRFCSYCIIPYARGRVRSKPLGQLQKEIITLAEKGFKEIVLVGINLSAYGEEFGLCLADAVEITCAVDGIERVRLGSLEPERMDSQMIKRLSVQKKLCPQFHLSLQSGCDATLKRMNRHYDTKEYTEIVTNLRNTFDNCAITTDIMVGFPAETDEEFEQSLAFAQKIKFAKVHTFAYSRRQGTVADKSPNQIAENIKNIRSKQMIALTDTTMNDFLQNQIGRTEPVLFERQKNGLWEGHTMNYTPVTLQSNENLANKIIDVKITAVENNKCIGNYEVLKGCTL